MKKEEKWEGVGNVGFETIPYVSSKLELWCEAP